ncbi:phosphatidylinositol 3,4,5-trisphosphate 3-phosphatase and dual-specificity protein phosphatase PTEN isoform X2 [Coccinella septempunctata]|uniref:phosphatidylinositol 3,4,5-trisphosphate 3-phosphatase and dual-specificity protein phosphatase PTEN isoform X2 n=1 Tax=Coccinella septempunctata TaxID=41139 RepID=UPI001D077357|nr:phosphatidylinositol 3,4,5-trisphosphate 3-phosphatase and dual-specificity protein phosphatase PTEN isoform X2 [Coccinella septempunctata]
MNIRFVYGIFCENEGTKLCQPQALINPVSFTNILSSAKREQIGTLKASSLPPVVYKRIRRTTMAAMFPSMNYLKTIVSKNRNRHREQGFDLDLTYITDRIIAMAYPAERVQSIFRNHLNDVYDFLEMKHKDHYYIYNLCSERSYDKAKFCNRVKVYPFDDHNPPSFVIIESFCKDVHQWLEADPKNVIAIHCKAGKGRTGTMICCYLLHCGLYNNAEDALKFYGSMRTQDGQGVTIPSQIRYVKYYAQFLKENLTYVPKRLYIRKIHLKPAPKFSEPVLVTVKQKTFLENPRNIKLCSKEAKGDCKKIDENSDVGETSRTEESYEGKYHEMTLGFKSRTFNFRTSDPEVSLDFKVPSSLSGDIRIELFYRSPVFTKKKRFARIWINTFFAALNGVTKDNNIRNLIFKKHELDIVGKKDKNNRQLSEDFELTVEIKLPSHDDETRDSLDGSTKEGEIRGSVTSLYEDSSGAEDDTDDDNDWESGKSQLLSSKNEDSEALLKDESKSNRQSDSSTEEKIFPKSKKQIGSSVSSSISLISSKVSNSSCENSMKNVECNQRSYSKNPFKEGTDEMAKQSPSITSSSSDVTPNTSAHTVIFISKKNKNTQNSNHSSCLELSTSPNSKVIRSKSATNVFSISESLSVVNIEGINKSRSGTLITTREIIDLPLAVSDVGPSSSTKDIASSTADAKVTNIKGSAGFFKSFTKKFSYRK